MTKKLPALPFHLRLKSERESLRLSQREVAEALKVSQALYSHWETGRRPVPKDHAKALPKAMRAARALADAAAAVRTKAMLNTYYGKVGTTKK